MTRNRTKLPTVNKLDATSKKTYGNISSVKAYAIDCEIKGQLTALQQLAL